MLRGSPISWKWSLDFRKSYNDLLFLVCFPHEHGPSFNLRKNVDLIQKLSRGHIHFFLTSLVLSLIYLWNKKYGNIEFDPQINYLGFQNLGELADWSRCFWILSFYWNLHKLKFLLYCMIQEFDNLKITMQESHCTFSQSFWSYIFKKALKFISELLGWWSLKSLDLLWRMRKITSVIELSLFLGFSLNGVMCSVQVPE